MFFVSLNIMSETKFYPKSLIFHLKGAEGLVTLVPTGLSTMYIIHVIIYILHNTVLTLLTTSKGPTSLEDPLYDRLM